MSVILSFTALMSASNRISAHLLSGLGTGGGESGRGMRRERSGGGVSGVVWVPHSEVLRGTGWATALGDSMNTSDNTVEVVAERTGTIRNGSGDNLRTGRVGRPRPLGLLGLGIRVFGLGEWSEEMDPEVDERESSSRTEFRAPVKLSGDKHHGAKRATFNGVPVLKRLGDIRGVPCWELERVGVEGLEDFSEVEGDGFKSILTGI